MRTVRVILGFIFVAIALSAGYLGGGAISGRSGSQDVVPILTRVSFSEFLGLAFGTAVVIGVGRRTAITLYLRGLIPRATTQLAIVAMLALTCGGLAAMGSFSYLASFVPGAFLAIQSGVRRRRKGQSESPAAD